MSVSGKFRNIADNHITKLTDTTDINTYQCQVNPAYYLNILYIYLAITLLHFAIMIQIRIPFKSSYNSTLPHSIYEYASYFTHKKVEIKR